MATNYNPSIVTSGLVLCLDAGNTRSYPGSGTTWTDLSGNGNTGTLTNGPTYSSNNGGSLVFDGTNDYVATSFTPSNSCSISIWFNNNNTYNVHNRGLFSTYGTSVYSGFYIGTTILATGGLRIFYNGNGNTVLSYTFAVNTWYNVCVTSSGSLILVYVNGYLVNNIASGTTHQNPLAIGITRFDANYWTGNIAATSMYNTVLTADQVLQNYNALRGRFGL